MCKFYHLKSSISFSKKLGSYLYLSVPVSPDRHGGKLQNPPLQHLTATPVEVTFLV